MGSKSTLRGDKRGFTESRCRINNFCNLEQYKPAKLPFSSHLSKAITLLFLKKFLTLIIELFIAFTMEQDIPDYDMDSEDERWLAVHTKNLEINELKVLQAKNI